MSCKQIVSMDGGTGHWNVHRMVVKGTIEDMWSDGAALDGVSFPESLVEDLVGIGSVGFALKIISCHGTQVVW